MHQNHDSGIEVYQLSGFLKTACIDAFISGSCCPGLSQAGDEVERSMHDLGEVIMKIRIGGEAC